MFGYSYFEVQPVDNMWKPLNGVNATKGDTSAEIKSPDATKPSNYIVSVYGEGAFSIQYSKKGGCILYRFSKPIYVLLNTNVTRCYSYEMNDMDDIEITTSIGNYDGGINNLNLTIDINGTILRMNQSTYTISYVNWIEYCPNLIRQYDRNKSTCFLKIYATSYVDIYMNLVAQYAGQ